jgi:hypothetical protein
MAIVSFERNGNQHTLSFAFDAEVVELIKMIPHTARSFDSATKQWTVKHGHVNGLVANLKKMGHTVIGLDDAKDDTKRDPKPDADPFLALLEHVGTTRAAATYKALSKVLHPDTATGDNRLQQQLNDAYEMNGAA